MRPTAKVIFVEYDLGIGGMLTPIYKLLMDLAIKEALCRKSNEGNVYFMIDEFRLLPHLEHVDDGVNFGRSLGAKFFLGVQNIEQVFGSDGLLPDAAVPTGRRRRRPEAHAAKDARGGKDRPDPV